MKIICGFDRLSFFLFRMPWLRNFWIDAATAPFYILFLLKINKRTVPALTCPYNYRHRMMTILFLLQAWHGYRFTFTQGRSAFLADAASLASFSPKMSSCRKSVFRFAVTDYMCLIQDAFPGIFFWIAIQALLFYFERELYFFLTRKAVFSKKNSPKLYFFWN